MIGGPRVLAEAPIEVAAKAHALRGVAPAGAESREDVLLTGRLVAPELLALVHERRLGVRADHLQGSAIDEEIHDQRPASEVVGLQDAVAVDVALPVIKELGQALGSRELALDRPAPPADRELLGAARVAEHEREIGAALGLHTIEEELHLLGTARGLLEGDHVRVDRRDHPGEGPGCLVHREPPARSRARGRPGGPTDGSGRSSGSRAVPQPPVANAIRSARV